LKQLEAALLNAKRGIKQIKQILNRDCRVLRNIDSFSNYFNVPIPSEENFNELKEKFDFFKKSNSVVLIDYSDVDIKTIFNDYFDENPPFNAGKKKHEFPDAFNIAAVVNWSVKNKKTVYFITNDKDFTEFDNESIKVKSLDEYLTLVFSEIAYEETTIYLSIESKIDLKQEQISKQINEFFQLNFEPEYNDLTFLKFEIYDINVSRFSVDSFVEGDAEVELIINSKFKFEYKIPEKTILAGHGVNELMYLDETSNVVESTLLYTVIVKIKMETNETDIVEFNLNPFYKEIEKEIKNVL